MLYLCLTAHVTYQSLNVENVIEVGRYLYLEKEDIMIGDNIILVIIISKVNIAKLIILPEVPRFPCSSAFPGSRQGPIEKIRIEDALGSSYLRPNEQQC